MDGMLGDREQGGEYLWDNETSLAASVTLACFMLDRCNTHTLAYTLAAPKFNLTLTGKRMGPVILKRCQAL